LAFAVAETLPFLLKLIFAVEVPPAVLVVFALPPFPPVADTVPPICCARVEPFPEIV
jgi:hypothetical protein